MKTFVLLSLLALALAAPELSDRQQFRQFQLDFGKTYQSSSEEEHRFRVFQSNLQTYREHNQKNLGWTMGVTKFSDLTLEEFRSKHLNGYLNLYKNPFGSHPSRDSKADVPNSMDWMAAITPVKDQGGCGSCWAFATAEMVESYAYLNDQTRPISPLSPQHMVSCVPNPNGCGGAGGCMGSIPELGFSYTQLYGMQSEEDYPYVSGNTGDSGECTFDPEGSGHAASAYVRGYETLPRNNYDAVIEHLANNGPLAVAIDASNWGSYIGGVFDGCPYDQNIQINHAVQLVGYGTDETTGEAFWTIRNSWGPTWGENGFIRLKRNVAPMCGTDDTPLIGTGCVNDGVASQYVCGTCGVLYDAVYPIGASYV